MSYEVDVVPGGDEIAVGTEGRGSGSRSKSRTVGTGPDSRGPHVEGGWDWGRDALVESRTGPGTGSRPPRESSSTSVGTPVCLGSKTRCTDGRPFTEEFVAKGVDTHCSDNGRTSQRPLCTRPAGGCAPTTRGFVSLPSGRGRVRRTDGSRGLTGWSHPVPQPGRGTEEARGRVRPRPTEYASSHPSRH